MEQWVRGLMESALRVEVFLPVMSYTASILSCWKKLISNRTELKDIASRPVNDWFYTRESMYKDFEYGGNFAGFTGYAERLSKPTWWQKPGLHPEEYFEYITESRLKHKPWYMNPRYFQSVHAPAIICESAAANHSKAYYNAVGKLFPSTFTAGADPDTLRAEDQRLQQPVTVAVSHKVTQLLTAKLTA